MANQVRKGKEYFIDEAHHDYKDNPLIALDAKFEGNRADFENFFSIYSHIVGK